MAWVYREVFIEKDEPLRFSRRRIRHALQDRGAHCGRKTADASGTPHRPTDLVQVRLAPDETRLRDAIQLLGGRWHRKTNTWQLAYAAATALRITNRITLYPNHLSLAQCCPSPRQKTTTMPSILN